MMTHMSHEPAEREAAPAVPTDPGPGPEPSPASAQAMEQLVTRVYLAILRQKDATRALLVAQGMTGHLVDRALETLLTRGLIVPRGDGAWQPVAPDIALPAYAGELERQARAVRASAHELAQIFHDAHGGSSFHGDDRLYVLGSIDELHSATAEIVATAQHSVRCLRDLSVRTRRLFGAPIASHRERAYSASGQPLEFRSTYVVDVLDLPEAREVLAARAEGGESFRFVSRAPFSAVVVDRSSAVLDVSAHEESGAGSLLVRSGPLVQAIANTVDEAWRVGTSVERAVGNSPLEDRDVQILALLATGASDATIARQLGISQRTVERRLRGVMDRLGARTRFQAGIAATRRGWV